MMVWAQNLKNHEKSRENEAQFDDSGFIHDYLVQSRAPKTRP